jgi:hypothetical protein
MMIEMFTIPLYKYEIFDWRCKKTKLLELYQSLNTQVLDNVITSWNCNSQLLTSHCKNVFGEEIHKFKNEIGVNLDVEDFWFQEYKKGMNHQPHTHGPLGFSAVAYIKYNNQKHDSTVFISPYSCNVTGIPSTYRPEVNEGEIIFFPANILHYARQNNTDENRLICSFNLINPRPW